MLNQMRIVSLCHYLQGPAATQYLADMGADVIKVEPPEGAFERHWSGARTFVDRVSAFYLSANRNKRSLAIDLKRPEARAVMLRLVRSADVVVENFRPGVMERLGLGYADLKAAKPDIIYASATGFGADGPLRDKPGQDLLMQARAGVVAASGDPTRRPTPAGFAVVDQHGGALLAMGILGAYARRLTTGEGTRVEASLFNAGIDLQTEALTLYYSGARTRAVMPRDENLATWFHEAPYGVYKLADGFLALSMNDPGTVATALGDTELAALAAQDVYAIRDRFAAALARALAPLTLGEVAERFEPHGIWYQRVQDYDDLRRDPQALHNDVFREVQVGKSSATLVNHPLRYDGQTPAYRGMALQPGANTDEILGELDYTAQEVDALLDAKVVFAPPRQVASEAQTKEAECQSSM